jgi:hypothetical protein
MLRLGRVLMVVAILLVLTGGLLLTDYNMRQLQGGEGALQLNSKNIREVVMRFPAAAAVLLDDCSSFLSDACEALKGCIRLDQGDSCL